MFYSLSFFGIALIIVGTFLQTSNHNIGKSKKENRKIENIVEKKYNNPLPALRELYQNDDIIAEIAISSLDFKELVVKANDNNYYLNHDIQKKDNKCGATFLDYRIENIDTAKQINIYGHNSDYYTLPFGVLENYQEESFFNEHLDVTLQTDSNLYHYKIFAISTIPKESDEHMLISSEQKDFLEHIKVMREKALFDTQEKITEKDKILILQTCLFNPERYLLLLAKKI